VAVGCERVFNVCMCKQSTLFIFTFTFQCIVQSSKRRYERNYEKLNKNIQNIINIAANSYNQHELRTEKSVICDTSSNQISREIN
jgi:hypothetical protein